MSACDPQTTALVLIDLQGGIVSRPWAPRGGAEVLATCRTLAERFRSAGAAVVLVRVAFAPDYGDIPPQAVDEPMALPPGGMPAAWSTLADGLQQPGDLVVTKRQWGAFTGTDLDVQLRRRGIRTIVLGGIATNFGVESTARHAWELGYDLIVVEDACAGPTTELHQMAIRAVFPRIAHVLTAEAISFADGARDKD